MSGRFERTIIRHDSTTRFFGPIGKLGAGLVFVISVSFSPKGSWLAFAIFTSLLLIWSVLLKINLRKIFRPILYFETLALTIACLSLFQPDGPTVFFSLLIKSTLCISCMVIISSSTTFSEMMAGLKHLRLPSLLTITLVLTYRYLFLLVEEANRMRRARSSRTLQPTRFGIWSHLGQDIGRLFIRTASRGERIYSAMSSRGWQP